MSTPATTVETPAASSASPGTPARPAWQPPARRSRDTLQAAWLHGSLHFGVFRRTKMAETWTSPTPVRTVAEFGTALDEALTALKFTGTEVTLILEHEEFVHRTEQAPGFSDAAARNFLKGRMARHEKEHGATLWVSQQTYSPKQDRAYILHILPSAFYDSLNQLMLTRRLALAGILPLMVPIQRDLNRFPIAKNRPVLVAVEAGGVTIVLVAQVGGQILFARTILASWAAEPSRIGLEINRSLLYSNQQFGLSVERIWLLGQDNNSTSQVNAKVGAGKQITVLPTAPIEWLQSAAKLPAQQPVNLVVGYLLKKRRNFYLRTLLLALTWGALALFGFDTWNRQQAWSQERARFTQLAAREAASTVERDQLVERNQRVAAQQAFIQQVEGDRLPPVAAKFLGYATSLLPSEIRLSDFSVKWNGGNEGWSFRCEGTVEADEETAREIVTAWQRQLARGPLRVRFTETARAVISVSVPLGAATPESHRFNVEGSMLENQN